jgi:hypothetical protein
VSTIRLHVLASDHETYEAKPTGEQLSISWGDYDSPAVGDRIQHCGRSFTVTRREWDEDRLLHLQVMERAR